MDWNTQPGQHSLKEPLSDLSLYRYDKVMARNVLYISHPVMHATVFWLSALLMSILCAESQLELLQHVTRL